MLKKEIESCDDEIVYVGGDFYVPGSFDPSASCKRTIIDRERPEQASRWKRRRKLNAEPGKHYW